jgi:hypothetical protein
MSTYKSGKKLGKRVERLEAILPCIEGELSDLKRVVFADEQQVSATIETFKKPIRITADQAASISEGGGWLMSVDRRDGWLFIGSLDYPADDGGNGCWINTRGEEEHGG